MTAPISSYKPRHMRALEHWECDGLIFKPYAISASPGKPVPQSLLDSAKAYVDVALPALRRLEGTDHAVGYVIVHSGVMSNWLLAHWWAHEDIALRLLASADHGTSAFKSEDHRRFHACVWEHVVIDHERNAWVRHAMREHGNLKEYLTDRLADGNY